MDKDPTKLITKKAEMDLPEGTWHAQTVQTAESDAVQMVDDGRGKAHVLRIFDFDIDPKVARELKEKKIKLSKQEIFNQHWPFLQTLIWGDGLIANRDVAPRVMLSKDKKHYRICLLCEPKNKSVVADKIQTLQEIFKKK